MRLNDVTPERLRALSALRPPGKVLSLYLDLDPEQFATNEARSTAVTSLLDGAHRDVEARDDLEHDEKVALREDVERARQVLALDALPAEGASAVAVFASRPGDLLEVLRLPHTVESRAVIDDTPYVVPLAEVAHEAADRWCVALVAGGGARFFLGVPHALHEVDGIAGHHHFRRDRWERHVDSEVERHLREVADALKDGRQQGLYEHLLLGGPHEDVARLRPLLTDEVAALIAGEIDVDIRSASDEAVTAEADRVFAERLANHERDLLERFAAGMGGGPKPAAGGLTATLQALTEQRVETLLLARDFAAAGVRCRRCGLLAASGETCPADGSALEALDDIVEPAVTRAVEQDAEIHTTDAHGPLGPHGGIGAVLRF